LGERLGLGRAWAGAVLLAAATTLPELVTTVTSVLRGELGLAIGGLVGSVTFNLFILVLADLVDREPIYHRLSLAHLGTGLLGCVMLGLLIAGLAGGASGGLRIGRMGLLPLGMVAAYVLGQLVIFRMAKEAGPDRRMKVPTVFDRFSLRALIGAYVAVGVVILVSARQLSISADLLAEHYGWAKTFAGATLLGVVTSLPEMTNALACARSKEHDLAVGNILGANAVVLTVLALADLLYPAGPLLWLVPANETRSAITMAGLAIAMQGTALGALAVRSRHRLWRLGAASLVLAGLYAASLRISYSLGRSEASPGPASGQWIGP
jgi:cation:H+ antiporter